MKFLCSILILAGLFVLNDAFPSIENEFRRVNDQFVLANLRQMVQNKDAGSQACSQGFLQNLTEVLNTYNGALGNCSTAKQTAIDGFLKDASEKIEDIKSRMTCEDDCSSLTELVDVLECMQNETSASSRKLSTMSVESATCKTELKKNLENCNGLFKVCGQTANANYETSSAAANSDYATCMSSIRK